MIQTGKTIFSVNMNLSLMSIDFWMHQISKKKTAILIRKTGKKVQGT